MGRKIGHWAMLGMEMAARAKVPRTGQDTTSARSRLVQVLYYPRSQRLAYRCRDGVCSKAVALMELEKEAKLDGMY
jgi:hypothetical protein